MGYIKGPPNLFPVIVFSISKSCFWNVGGCWRQLMFFLVLLHAAPKIKYIFLFARFIVFWISKTKSDSQGSYFYSESVLVLVHRFFCQSIIASKRKKTTLDGVSSFCFCCFVDLPIASGIFFIYEWKGMVFWGWGRESWNDKLKYTGF